jgi:hypothetical protein
MGPGKGGTEISVEGRCTWVGLSKASAGATPPPKNM